MAVDVRPTRTVTEIVSPTVHSVGPCTIALVMVKSFAVHRLPWPGAVGQVWATVEFTTAR